MPRSAIQEGLLRAAAATLRPLVHRLLASGVPFGVLQGRLRELFVEVATHDLAIPDRPQTDSRIALVTGLNRKEVRRLRAGNPRKKAPASFSRNQAASLISRWLADRRATDAAGRPRAIPYQAARGSSFVKLSRAVTADLPPRAILDELVRTGAVELRPGNLVALRTDAYVPKAGRPEKLAMVAEDPAELVETMLRNALAESDEEPLLQRKVLYDNVGADALARVRLAMRREGERFLRRVDGVLAKHDRDRNPEAAGGPRQYAGVGVYYFEGPHRPGTAGAGHPDTARARPKSRSRKKERRR